MEEFIQINDISKNSFEDVDEDVSLELDRISIQDKSDVFLVSEELSSIPKISRLDELKVNTSLLNEKINSKLANLKSSKALLSPSDLEEFLSIEKYIKNLEENPDCSNANMCIELECIEKLRKQQDMMIRLLDQISLLQWEVEKEYKKIKENEIRNKVNASDNSRVEFENIQFCHKINCSCGIT